MKLKESVVVLTILVIANCSQAFAQSASFFGAYQNCPFGCEAIQINRDGTFVHQLDGDLFNDIRTRGTWKFIGKNRIRAVSASANTEPLVVETEAKRSGSFLVMIVDAFGGLVQGAKVSGSRNGVAFAHESNAQGVVEIPECEQFEIMLGGGRTYRGTHKIKNRAAKEFIITLTNEQSFIDEIWQVESGCLYFVEPNGSLNRDYCLKKLSRKKAERIFGTAMPNKALQLTARSHVSQVIFSARLGC